MAENTEGAKRGGLPFGAGLISTTDRLVSELSSPSRRMRQEAAHMLAELAKNSPERVEAGLETVVPALIEALERPEAQTRWESLDALSELAANHADVVSEAFEAAEAAMFDEGSSRVSSAAFRLIARLACSSAEMSDKAWPVLDEAIQCFHGDTGYRDMLASMVELAGSNASDDTKQALAARVAFDATSGRGYVKKYSAQIVEVVKGA